MKKKRNPKKAKIITYKQLKAAAGGSGSSSGGGGGFRPGQNVVCRILHEEPGGYAVVLVETHLPGFLPTQARFRPGEEVLAQFVCVDNHRVILSGRFSNSSTSPEEADKQASCWQQHLDAIDQETADCPVSFHDLPRTIDPPPAMYAGSPAGGRTYRMKRATDLMLPPMSLDDPFKFKIEDYDLQWLITDLEGGVRTCCVKAFNESNLSRSSILVYRGRVVGCIYANKFEPAPKPTEESLQLMIADLRDSETEVEMYDLPEYVVLSMSSLFLGYPVSRNDDYNARCYMDYVCAWFEKKKQTACLAITLPSTSATCLAFIYNGNFCGAFYVEDQKFLTDKEFVYELFRNDPKADIEASILPPMVSPFGFPWSPADR